MIEGTTPFDRKELEACYNCKLGMAHDNNLTFIEVTVTQCVLDLHSIRQQHGLETMLGMAAPLVAVLSPTTNVAYRMTPVRRLLCLECAGKPMPVFSLMEDDD